MADEQRESYTKLFNPILEAICKKELTGRELRIVLFVIRATYGWNKKKFPLSKSYIAEGTGISTRNVSRIVRRLVERNILIEYGTDKNTRAKVYGLNKKYSKWDAMSVTDDTDNGDRVCMTTGDHDPDNGDRDMSVTDDRQKRHIKRHILKEKEKKCTQKEHFFLNEDGIWERSIEDVEEESGEE